MAKSDARFGYKADLKRSDHDLSQRFGLTAAPGMELPIWFDFASPGDSYYISHDMPLLRSKNLAGPAMIDVKVHYETFFVPMQMIYQPFENTFFSLSNLQSSNYFTPDLQNNNFPLFDFSTFCSDLRLNHGHSDYTADAFRMCDLFGFNPQCIIDGLKRSQSAYTPSFFPWQILAYHTIYQYYYRLDDKDSFANDFCNWDKYYNSTTPVTPIYRFMEIHQRPWDFDYFMSVYRSPIISAFNSQQTLPYGNYSDLVNIPTSGIQFGGQANSNNNAKDSFSNIVNTVNQNSVQMAISTAGIRQMFANEKLAMITGRTKKNYDSQVLAHYGFSVPHDVKHDITMIHHDEFELKVLQVTDTANTTGSSLGELAGQSYSTGNGKQFKFTAPCHGVMMTLLCVEPKKRYIGGFDRINAITNSFDFPVPEFDRLGNQPMYRFECGYDEDQYSTFANTDIIGWKERYYAFKRKYDKCTHAFVTGSGLGSNNYSCYMLADRPFATPDFHAGLTSAESQRPDLVQRFYIERNACDNLLFIPFLHGFSYPNDGQSGEDWRVNPYLLYARDPFIINSFVKAKKVSWMSKDGEPIYNF